MKWMVGAMAAVAIGGVVSGCATPMLALAPGAEQIKETRVAGDVAGCGVVGHVTSDAGPLDMDTEVRNKTLGFGGDVLFVTSKLGATEGVAYRCN